MAIARRTAWLVMAGMLFAAAAPRPAFTQRVVDYYRGEFGERASEVSFRGTHAEPYNSATPVISRDGRYAYLLEDGVAVLRLA